MLACRVMSSKRKNTPTKLLSTSAASDDPEGMMLHDLRTSTNAHVVVRAECCHSDGDSNHSDDQNLNDGTSRGGALSDSGSPMTVLTGVENESYQNSLKASLQASPKRTRNDSESSSSSPHSPHYKKQRLMQSLNNNDDTPAASPHSQDNDGSGDNDNSNIENQHQHHQIITTNNNNVILSGSKSPNAIQRKSMHSVLNKLTQQKVDENGGGEEPVDKDFLLTGVPEQLMNQELPKEEKERRINDMIMQLQKYKDTLNSANAQSVSTPLRYTYLV